MHHADLQPAPMEHVSIDSDSKWPGIIIACQRDPAYNHSISTANAPPNYPPKSQAKFPEGQISLSSVFPPIFNPSLSLILASL